MKPSRNTWIFIVLVSSLALIYAVYTLMFISPNSFNFWDFRAFAIFPVCIILIIYGLWKLRTPK